MTDKTPFAIGCQAMMGAGTGADAAQSSLRAILFIAVNSIRKFFVHPLVPLLAFVIALTVFLTTYLATGVTPSTAFEFVASFSWSLLLAIWVVADARRQQNIPCFDCGFFCYLFLPIVVPGYCFWSRGWRGAITLLTLGAIWLAPYIVATGVWWVLYGRYTL